MLFFILSPVLALANLEITSNKKEGCHDNRKKDYGKY